MRNSVDWKNFEKNQDGSIVTCAEHTTSDIWQSSQLQPHWLETVHVIYSGLNEITYLLTYLRQFHTDASTHC